MLLTKKNTPTKNDLTSASQYIIYIMHIRTPLFHYYYKRGLFYRLYRKTKMADIEKRYFAKPWYVIYY